MTWQELQHRIQLEIRPNHSSILKSDGVERRPVTSNNGNKIGMRTGVKSPQSKAITYEMIRYAFEVLSAKGRFDSEDFRIHFNREYEAAPCRFSMTGGILVELGLATILPSQDDERCCYTKNS